MCSFHEGHSCQFAVTERFPGTFSIDIDYLYHSCLCCCARFWSQNPQLFRRGKGLFPTPGGTAAVGHWQLEASPALPFLLSMRHGGQDGEGGHCATRHGVCSLSRGQQLVGWQAGEGKREWLYFVCSCPCCPLTCNRMGWLGGASFPFPVPFLPVLRKGVGRCIPWDSPGQAGKTRAQSSPK